MKDGLDRDIRQIQVRQGILEWYRRSKVILPLYEIEELVSKIMEQFPDAL